MDAAHPGAGAAGGGGLGHWDERDGGVPFSIAFFSALWAAEKTLPQPKLFPGKLNSLFRLVLLKAVLPKRS